MKEMNAISLILSILHLLVIQLMKKKKKKKKTFYKCVF